MCNLEDKDLPRGCVLGVVCPEGCLAVWQTPPLNRMTLRQMPVKQECIPVGCIPAACRPFAGVCFPGGGLPGLGGGAWSGGCLVRGVTAWSRGMPAWSGGLVSQHALRQNPSPVNRMTDRCKNITLATTSLRPVNITLPKLRCRW